MNKEMKEKMIKARKEMKLAFPNLYDERWVEKAADTGYKQLTEDLRKQDPKLGEAAASKKGYNLIAIIYYTAFENALNTFFEQCLDDTVTNCELYLDELHKITAQMKEIVNSKNQ